MGSELIHKTAIIEGNVSIGNNVKVGPYAYLSGEIQIGDNTEIGHCVQIEGNVIIGNYNKIGHSAHIGAPPQDVAYNGSNTSVTIGNDNIIREFVQIHRGTKEGTSTEIGSSCFLMGGVHLAHNTKLGNNVTIANNSMLAGYVEIDDFAFVSGLCGFHQFVRVGKYAMIGGLSRITKDCPTFMTVEGNPARVAGVNVIGLRRREFTPERRKSIKDAYRILYRSGLNVSQAIDELLPSKDNADIGEIINFIKLSDRGIIK
ncbi:MAG: acyl-ACP--UDP-N-acetylglucosamine O-acyltransferase [Spirochaetes bacterium]|nr:acyl-ACP--UDP-N-acetylglucosamine O-acyltransferase [Spirochaetota bacterium]